MTEQELKAENERPWAENHRLLGEKTPLAQRVAVLEAAGRASTRPPRLRATSARPTPSGRAASPVTQRPQPERADRHGQETGPSGLFG